LVAFSLLSCLVVFLVLSNRCSCCPALSC
jgi:hypothetical protein